MAEIFEEIEWNSDITEAFGHYRTISLALGIWPYNCQTISALFLTTLSVFTQVTMIISLGVENIISDAVNPQMMSFGSCCVLSLSKVLLVRFHFRKVRCVVHELTSAWKTVVNIEVMKDMKAKAKLGKRVCLCQLFSTYFVCLPTIIGSLPMFAPILNDTMNDTGPVLRTFPISTPHLYPNISTEVYVTIFIYQLIQLFFTTTGNVGNDGFFFGLAMNLTAQLNRLALDFEKESITVDESSRKKIFAVNIEKQVKLIELAEYLEATFSFAAFTVVSACCSQICFYGIVMIRSTRTGDFVSFINSFICVIILVLQIFVYSYAGDHLSRSIEHLGIASYKSSWYDMPLNDKRCMIFILMRTSKVYSFTAGKIYRMDLDSFKSIMKALGSYFSVMQAAFNE